MRNEPIPISSEQKILIGRPTHAPSEEILLALSRVVSGLPQCLEVHVPQYFAIGAMQAPRLALVLVVRDDDDREVFAEKAQAALFEYLPESLQMDVWVITGRDPLLPAVRRAACPIHR